uniref:Uncharacterized protein n=1 Tax=Arcella intermedia TaxID=1963864 RepID=A0A6B2KYE8_9EUKA
MLPGGISQIDQEIERIRKGEPDQFEAPSIVNISKDDMKEMIADVEEIEKRGPEQFKSNQKNAESATPARDPEELKQIIDVLAEEDTLDDIDSPELDDLELKLREELEPQKKDLSDFVMPSEDLKDENFNEAYVDVVNQMEVDDIEAEFPTEQEEELTTIEEMDNFEERQMEEFSENAAAQLKHGPPIESDRDYFVKPVPFPIPKLEFSQEMPDFEKHVMDTNTDDTPDIPNLDLSCLDPSYNFLERTEQQLLEEREIHPTMMSERWGVLNMKVGKLFLVQRTSCIRTNRLPSERKELEDGLTYTPLPYPEFGDSSPLPMDEQPPVQVKEDEEDIPNEEDEEQSKTLYPETLGAMNELRNHLSTIDALKRDNCVSERDKEGLRKVESILVAYAKRNNIPLSHDDEMESEESESFDTSMKSLEKELNGEDEVIINSQYLTNLDKEDEELQEDQVDEGENVVGEGEQVVGEGEEVGEGDIAVEEGVSAKDGKEEAVARGDSEYDSKNENMEEEDEEFTDLDPNYAPIMEMVADMPIEDTDEPAQELPTSIEEYTEMKMKEMKEAEARAETETPKKDEEESTSEVEPLDVDEVIRICETLDSTNPKTEEFKKNMQRLVAFNYLPSKTMRSKYYHPEIPPEAWEEVRKQTQLEVDEWLEFDKKCNKSFLETNGPTTLQAKMIDISPKQLLEMKKVTWPFATPVTFTNPLRLILSVDWAKQSCPWAVPED